MEINFLELWERMGTPVRAVVIVLTLQALACVTVVIDRFVVLLGSAAKARNFAERVQPALEKREYDKALGLAGEFKGSHLATYLSLGLRTFTTHLKAGTPSPAPLSSPGAPWSAKATPSAVTSTAA